MPGGDRTGPMGNGPMTGRGSGYCAGNDRPGFFGNRPFFGRRTGFFGRGRGFFSEFARGFGRMAGTAYERDPNYEDDYDNLNRINNRLTKLEKKLDDLLRDDKT